MSGLFSAWSWRLAEGLIFAVGVEGEAAEKVAGFGVDDADVAVVGCPANFGRVVSGGYYAADGILCLLM
jgi:hypothetical protein